MGFATLSFVFAFLPVSILLFYISPKKWKTPVLLAISLLFYITLDPTNLVMMLVSITYDYLMAHLILAAKKDVRLRKIPLMACVVKNLLLIVVFGVQYQMTKIGVPLGLMVYTMTSMGYVIDVYRGDEPLESNWLNFALFCTFFGKIFYGPIVQYSVMRQDIVDRKPSLSGISTGLIVFTTGLAKQVILAQGALGVYRQITKIPYSEYSVAAVWVLVISFSFTMYFTLSGYSDMAQGLAQIFSMQLPESYRYPLQSRTVSGFFNRFNITVTQYINRYVYVFLGGDQGGFLSHALNTLLTAMLLGLWFGIRLNYLMWGVYFALFMLLEKYFLMKYLKKIPVLFNRMYTFAIVVMSFTIFSGSSLGYTCYYLRAMFQFKTRDLLDGRTAYILNSNSLVLALCFLGLTSLWEKASQWLQKKYPALSAGLSGVFHIGLLTVTVALML